MKLLRLSAVIGVSVVYFGHVFQLPHGAFWTAGLGDWVDPYFINYLLEHWHHSLRHFTDPSSPTMYFPVRGTLGYSHGLILYAPFYVAMRPFMDAFQAYNVTLLLVLEIGSVCLYVVFRRVGLDSLESLLLSAFFFTSGNVVDEKVAIWSQRASVFLIPPILLMAMASARMSDGRVRTALAALSGLLAGLLYAQDFYTAHLALLVAALLLIGTVWLLPDRPLRAAGGYLRSAFATLTEPIDTGRPIVRPSRGWLIAASLGVLGMIVVWVHPMPRVTFGPARFSATDPTRPLLFALFTAGWFAFRRWDLADRLSRACRRVFTKLSAQWSQDRWTIALVAGFVVGGVVFLWLYMPAYREHRAFPEDQLIGALKTIDPARLREDFMAPLHGYDSLRPFELILVLAIAAWLPGFAVPRNIRRYSVWVLAVSLLVLAIPLSVNGFSLWKAILAPLPGFGVIRDPKRIIYLYELAAAIVAALFVARLRKGSAARRAVSVMVAILIATVWYWRVFPFERTRGPYYQWVQAPIGIDGSCRSFFIKGASETYMSRSFHKWALYNVDAMFISLNHSIPTLNGYSAWVPDGWELANPQEHDYAKAVAEWIERYDLRNVCELDIERRTMNPYRLAQTPE